MRWRNSVNKTRKERYANDPDYRSKVRRASRHSARKASGGFLIKRAEVCSDSLDSLDADTPTRRLSEWKGSKRALTTPELAPLIGLSSASMLNSWQAHGKFPRPKLTVIVGKTHAKAYPLETARKLLEVMRVHFADKNNLAKKDTVTIRKLHAVME